MHHSWRSLVGECSQVGEGWTGVRLLVDGVIAELREQGCGGLDVFYGCVAFVLLGKSSQECLCVLLCFIKPILGNHYVWSRGFIVSEPMETHPRSEIADVPTSPCPPLDDLGCPDPHPPP